MKGCLEIVSKSGKGLAPCLDSLQKIIKVLILLEIFLDLGLEVLIVLHRLHDLHNRPSWVRHRRVLLFEVSLCLRGVFTTESFIQGLVVCHNECAFIVDRSSILKGIIHY